MYYKERLKEVRELKEVKQSDIAKYLGVSNKTYSAYEIEYEIIPSKHLIVICNYFDISLDYVFQFTKTKQYPNINKEINPIIAGQRLKEFRLEYKLTQIKLANILNTTLVFSSKLGLTDLK